MKFKIFLIISVFLISNSYVQAVPTSFGGGINKSSVQLNQIHRRSLDLRKIAKEASMELKEEEDKILGDLRILWPYAVESSETIKFAIYKLSDPNGENKKDKSKLKKFLKPIASIAPFAAAATASPVAAGTSMVGGNLLNSVFSEDQYNKQLQKVTDADLVILAKAIEDLQNDLVGSYYEYVASKKILAMADRNLQNREVFLKKAQNDTDKSLVIADAFYREAMAKQKKAQENLLLKRAALEQLVGNDAILTIENSNK